MNQGRIWTVVNPNHGLPLFLGSVALIALIVHYAILSHTTWYPAYFQGGAQEGGSDRDDGSDRSDLVHRLRPFKHPLARTPCVPAGGQQPPSLKGPLREALRSQRRCFVSPSERSTIWIGFGARFLPFADAATPDLPLSRLLRLSLFQVSVGMALVLLVGTLNRVMIVELNVPASLVGVMISLPLLFAPFRAVIGFRSDVHKSALGWRRVPFMYRGTMVQFCGLAIMPFALLVLSGTEQASKAPAWLGLGRRGRRVPAGRRRTAHDSDHRPGARHRSRQRRVAAEGGRPHVHHDAARHDGERARLRRVPAGFHARPAGSGHSGRRGRDHRAQRRRAVEAGAARALQPARARARAELCRILGALRLRRATRCAVWPRSASAPWRSAWKTCCSSPMAGRCSASRSATPRN